MDDIRYKKMLKAFFLTRKYLEQQKDLGLEELHLQFDPPEITQKENNFSVKTLQDFYDQIKDCAKCHLSQTRTNLVFGTGNSQAEVMLVGEAPGREEDQKGEPFVGRAGQLLDKILEAIKFTRQQVYIANILKCRPPENRDPNPEEIELCQPHLIQQIKIIKPKIICALGRIAAQSLLRTKLPLGQLRGKFYDYQGTKLLVTYHPAALLRYPQYKKQTWEDVKSLRREYESMGLG